MGHKGGREGTGLMAGNGGVEGSMYYWEVARQWDIKGENEREPGSYRVISRRLWGGGEMWRQGGYWEIGR